MTTPQLTQVRDPRELPCTCAAYSTGQMSGLYTYYALVCNNPPTATAMYSATAFPSPLGCPGVGSTCNCQGKAHCTEEPEIGRGGRPRFRRYPATGHVIDALCADAGLAGYAPPDCELEDVDNAVTVTATYFNRPCPNVGNNPREFWFRVAQVHVVPPNGLPSHCFAFACEIAPRSETPRHRATFFPSDVHPGKCACRLDTYDEQDRFIQVSAITFRPIRND
jgi:hypothetical protein